MKFGKLLGASLLGSVLFLTSLNAVAASADAGLKKDLGMKNYDDPWGMGGCGFASLFIKDKGQGTQILASVVNYAFSAYTNSSAISSGSSNCVANRNNVAVNAQEVFITVNLASLSKEAAQGDGEHISALADVFGCPHDQFAKLSQTHYKDIYGTNEPTSVRQNYLKEVNADQSLAKSCSRTI